MDLLERLDVTDGDFKGRDADDRAILLVQLVDVEAAATGDDGALEAEVREAGIPGPWKVGEWCEDASEECLGTIRMWAISGSYEYLTWRK